MRKTIIFDMDGTLYRFMGGTFKDSGLAAAIGRKMLEFVSDRLNVTSAEAKEIIDNIRAKYGQQISLGLEQEFLLSRYDYFDFAWNLDPADFVEPDPTVRQIFQTLEPGFDFVLLSEAPRIWITKILDYLEITDFFAARIFSGEGDIRKSFNNAFGFVLETLALNPRLTFSVGDQFDTDIIPAKKLGLTTIFVGGETVFADYSVETLRDLPRLKPIQDELASLLG